jgi:hypothetical protein
MQLSHLHISHENHDYYLTIKGELPNEHCKITSICGTWNSYRFEVTITVTVPQKTSSIPVPFREYLAIGPLRSGQYCVVVNQREAWTKWFGVD